jgi:hypothetical protein
MSSHDAAPLPRLGEVFFDVRGSSRSMRVSWYGDTGVAVFSIWQGGRCSGTFRLPVDEMARMVETLRRGPDEPPAAPPQEPDRRPGRRRRPEPDGLPEGYGGESDDYRGEPDVSDAATGYLPPPAVPADPLGLDYRAPETAGYRDGGQGTDGPGYRGGDSAEYPPYGDGRPYADDQRYGPSEPYGDGPSYGESPSYREREPYPGSEPYGDEQPYLGSRPYVASQPYDDSQPYSDGQPYRDGQPYHVSQQYEDGRQYEDGQRYEDSQPYSDSRPHSDGQPYAYEDDDRLPYHQAPPAAYQDPRLFASPAGPRSPDRAARHAR